MRERFYRPTSENLSGKKKILKIGPLGAEITFMQKSNEKRLSGIGLRSVAHVNVSSECIKSHSEQIQAIQSL